VQRRGSNGGGGSERSKQASETASPARAVLVAKKAPLEGDFVDSTVPESVARGMNGGGGGHGPKVGRDGRIVAHSVLGDPDEYEANAKAQNLAEVVEHSKEEQQQQFKRDSVYVNAASSARTTPAPRDARAIAEEEGVEEVGEGQRGGRGKRSTQRRLGGSKKAAVDEAAKRQERALKRYEAMKKEWEKFRNKMSEKMGRDADELVFARSEDYREMLEEYDLLQKAVPVEERQASNVWLMSLRNSWTTYVPVGNAFSGLFCPVSERTSHEPNDITVIRNPEAVRDRIERSLSRNDDGSTKAKKKKGRRTWRDSQFLQKRLHDLKRTLEKLRPHVPPAGTMKIVGQTVREGDTERRERLAGIDEMMEGGVTGVPELKLDSTGRKGGEGGDVMEVTNAVSGLSLTDMELQSTNRTMGSNATMGIRYSHFDGVHSEEETGGEGEHQVRGPALTVSEERLFFETVIGDAPTSKVVTLTNTGTTTLYVKVVHKKRQTKLGRMPDTVQRFFMDAEKFTLLPGRSADISFIYSSPTAGMYLDGYEVETVPALPTHVGFTLKGVTKSHDDGKVARAQFESELKEKEKMTTVHDTIESMLRGVHTPRSSEREGVEYGGRLPVAAEMEENKEAEAFKNANGGLGVYYTAEVYSEFKAIYMRAAAAAGDDSAEWDSSVRSLHDKIISIGEDGQRSASLGEFNAAVRKASEKPNLDALHYAIGYHTFVDLFDSIPDLAERALLSQSGVVQNEVEVEEGEGEGEGGEKKEEEEVTASTSAKEGEEGEGEGEGGEKGEEEEEKEKEGQAAAEPAIASDDPILKNPLFHALRAALCTSIDSFALLCEEGDRRSMELAMNKSKTPGAPNEGGRPPRPPAHPAASSSSSTSNGGGAPPSR